MSTLFKYLVCVLVQVSLSGVLFGQVSYRELLRETNEELKVERGLLLCNVYMRNDIDSILVLSRYFSELYRESNNNTFKFCAHKMNGSYLLRNGQLEASRNSSLLALNGIEKGGLENVFSEIFVEIGNSYFLSGEGRLAIESYLLSMNIGEQSQDVTSHYNGMLGLAKVYCSIGDTVLGLEFGDKFVYFAQRDHKYEALADAYAFLGMVYYDLGDTRKSTWNYKQSLFYSKRSGSMLHLAHGFNNRAILEYQSDQMDSSSFYFLKALALRKIVGNKKTVVESYFNLANFYIGNNDYGSANMYLDSSRILSRKYGFLQDEIDALEMIDSYNFEQKWKSRIKLLKDKLLNQNEVSSRIKELSSTLMKNSSNKRIYISPRNRGEYFPWIIMALILPIIVLFLMIIQKRLI